MQGMGGGWLGCPESTNLQDPPMLKDGTYHEPKEHTRTIESKLNWNRIGIESHVVGRIEIEARPPQMCNLRDAESKPGDHHTVIADAGNHLCLNSMPQIRQHKIKQMLAPCWSADAFI